MKSVLCVLTLLSAMVWSGCSRNESDSENRIDVKLMLKMSGIFSRVDPVPTPGEGIETLRVILVDNAGHTVKNQYFYNLSATASLLSQTLTIFDIPEGSYDFYFVANENHVPGLSVDLQALVPGSTVGLAQLASRVISVGSASVTLPQPVTARYRAVTVSKSIDRLSFDLTRTLTRWDITVENFAARPLTLDRILLGAFAPDKYYLFPQTPMSVPANTTYSPRTQVSGVVVAPSQSYALSPVYLYEGTPGATAYTLSARVDGVDLPAAVMTGISAAERNSRIRLHLKITPVAVILLDYQVENWEPNEVTVPSFD